MLGKGFLLSMTLAVAGATRDGVDFFVIGDYGWVQDLTDSNLTFDAMDSIKAKAEPGSNDDFEFFVTVGDNLYPRVGDSPTKEEFADMMNLFGSREHLKDLKIYPVRGNHDAYFDWKAEIELSKAYDSWEMENLFYTKEFVVGEKGEKLAILFVDSNLMICSDYSYAGDSGGHMLLSQDHIRLRDIQCENDEARKWGNRQYVWINEVVKRWDNDPDIVWKATVLHHPMWGKWYPDYAPLVLNYLPILQEHKFDLYLNGHEHVISYAHYPYSQIPAPTFDDLHENRFGSERKPLREFHCESN
jgi:hypothetical protein